MRSSGPARAFGLNAGARIGRYECVAPLAMGGMAEVYLARHRGAAGFEKLVVIKRVLPQLAVDADFVEMFLKEVRLAASLDHPGIAAVLDFGHDGHDYFMVLEYVRGYDLRSVIKAGVARQDRLPLDMAVGIAVEIAAALHHAHEQTGPSGRPLGIVHRDVSPSNVLISGTGAVKLIDFGIARAIGVSRTTRAGVIKGKAGYMSPEQCRDEPLDRRTDVFGLGVVLYEMTTGYRLFHASNDLAAMNKITEGRFTAPSEAVDDYPEALEEIVLRCLALEPGDRFSTCDAIREALEGFAIDHRLRISASARAQVLERWLGPPTEPVLGDPTRVDGGTSSATVVVDPPVVRTARRSPVVWVAAVALMGAGGLGAWMLAPEDDGAEPEPSMPTTTPTEPTPASTTSQRPDPTTVSASDSAEAPPPAERIDDGSGSNGQADAAAELDAETDAHRAGDAASTEAGAPETPQPPRARPRRRKTKPSSRTDESRHKTLLPPSMRP